MSNKCELTISRGKPEMRALLFSTVFYLAGIAGILYLRPSLMFQPDGRWKEFGLRAGEETTPFPFWAFCLLWAIVSYGLAHLLFREGPVDIPSATRTLAATVPPASYSLMSPLTASLSPEDALEPLGPAPAAPAAPKSKRRVAAAAEALAAANAKPGYYRLNETATRRNGVPRYIYVGPEFPGDEATAAGGGASDMED